MSGVTRITQSYPDQHDQTTAITQMQRAAAVAKEIAATVGHLIVTIQGRKYPTVAWWQSVGWAFNLTSTEVEVIKSKTDDGSIEYEATVAIVRIDTGETISRGSAIASSSERAPWARAAYSIRSMAITRATGRAYRHGCAIIPHMLSIESTPAEEMGDLSCIETAKKSTGPGDMSRALPPSVTADAKSSDQPTPPGGGVMAILRASQLEDQIDGLAAQVSEIASALGHTISPAAALVAAAKGTSSREEVRDKLMAKVASGHSKKSKMKEGKK